MLEPHATEPLPGLTGRTRCLEINDHPVPGTGWVEFARLWREFSAPSTEGTKYDSYLSVDIAAG